MIVHKSLIMDHKIIIDYDEISFNNIFDLIPYSNRTLILFNKNPVFISKNSFQQNNIIAKDLRFYVINFLETLNHKDLITIGGESYLYGLISSKFNYIINYTNSKSIYKDVIYNTYFYNKTVENYLIDYNKFINIKNGNILLINNAKLNLNLLNVINKRYYQFIIIINCHHFEFWNRINLLSNYKLIKRKYFVSKYFYVTVNILIYKNKIPTFISLGNNCSVAYHLQNLGLRTNSFPFDWCKVNIKQLNKVLKNNFKDFSDIKIHKYSLKHSYLFEHNKGSYIVKNSYNITFAHELLTNSKNDIEKLKYKLNNRVKRFLNNKDNNIIFIIFDIYNQSEYLLELIKHLQQYFNIFKILYIHNRENTISLNNLQFVKIIKIDYNQIDWSDWSYSNLNWFDIIFNNL